uniref:NADH-ubiquinone oxidoreductase chain 4L n=1 Tax=Coleoptera sp. 1 AH-2016 TaxID=1903823 RepID=A0A343C2E8_9COLE|nr:NADH dehydrogenase subunit 4L [Coleoptera sp. 1 AH-2016]
MYEYSLMVFFMSGILVFILKYNHFLIMLLSLEMVMLSLYLCMLMYVSYFVNEYFMCMFFLTLGVCEGALGLSLLVKMIRSYGNDHMSMSDNLW